MPHAASRLGATPKVSPVTAVVSAERQTSRSTPGDHVPLAAPGSAGIALVN